MIRPIRCKCSQRLAEFDDETGNVVMEYNHPSVVAVRNVILVCPRDTCERVTVFDGFRERKKQGRIIQRLDIEVKVYPKVK